MELRMDVTDRAAQRFLDDERGATAIEYSVMAAGIAMAVVGAIRVLGANVLNDLFSQLAGLFG
jgi:pilus assembly protein Flp/PilA